MLAVVFEMARDCLRHRNIANRGLWVNFDTSSSCHMPWLSGSDEQAGHFRELQISVCHALGGKPEKAGEVDVRGAFQSIVEGPNGSTSIVGRSHNVRVSLYVG